MALHPEQDCIFCKIIKGEIPSYTWYEDAEFKVILDRFPSKIGHTLILPKNHIENIFEIEPEQAARLFKLASLLSVRLKAALEPLGFQGLNILQNNGEIAGQTLPHFHMHLIPRYKDDNIHIGWEACDPPLDGFDELLKKLK